MTISLRSGVPALSETQSLTTPSGIGAGDAETPRNDVWVIVIDETAPQVIATDV